MPTIGEFLTGLEKNQATKDILDGKTSFGGFDGPPLPTNREFRAHVSRAEWRQSQAGKWQFAFTFEIDEDGLAATDEWLGRKFTEYYSKDGGNRVNDEKFARFIAESGIDLASVDRSSDQAFASSFEGSEFIIATRIWGTEGDRTGLRYLNRDRGQQPKASIAPPKPKSDSKNLRADISVNKDKGPETAEAPQEEEQADGPEQEAVSAPTPSVALPGNGRTDGVNLPPGLRIS